jgi:hypothetical protein
MGYGMVTALYRPPPLSARVCTLFYERKLDDGRVQMSTIKACIITMKEPLVSLGVLPSAAEENKTAGTN